MILTIARVVLVLTQNSIDYGNNCDINSIDYNSQLCAETGSTFLIMGTVIGGIVLVIYELNFYKYRMFMNVSDTKVFTEPVEFKQKKVETSCSKVIDISADKTTTEIGFASSPSFDFIIESVCESCGKKIVSNDQRISEGK